MGKGIGQGIESSELPIILSGSRLTYLIMVKAHEENHRVSQSTLWGSRTQAWFASWLRECATHAVPAARRGKS